MVSEGDKRTNETVRTMSVNVSFHPYRRKKVLSRQRYLCFYYTLDNLGNFMHKVKEIILPLHLPVPRYFPNRKRGFYSKFMIAPHLHYSLPWPLNQSLSVRQEVGALGEMEGRPRQGQPRGQASSLDGAVPRTSAI